jgi:SAM-dependent methyltransferase
MEDLEDTYWWYVARRKIVCETVRRFLTSNSEVLDFGSGSGGIAKALSEDGYKVVAADVSTEALAACRKAGLDTMDLKTTWPAAESLDCILACDVLEHVKEDVELLQKLRVALRPNGLLIATVPAYDFLWSGEDYISDHVRRYTRPLLARHAREAGFIIEKASYFNTFLLPLIAAILLYKRLLKPRDMYVSDIRPLPQWQNGILLKILMSERFVLPRCDLPIGASVLVVARNGMCG